ncbi:CATRA conflict system CASPASE/TPR repeat-associated protein [Pseudonocardia endophytica]|uniref:Uncharacterized protein n=1 Tax=Pseudonocardia endophytica TaxID=401976 RepID=A0A4R1HJ22_PSEEN|nr:CATRA conflict system CASPASE/TPR repeat-associated protein [Pseudonocardia endophytica]TCK22267.1 hypothetical protein EV378_6268 [Pseudonocardia endophytica]
MPTSPALEGFELVTHVFVAATGDAAADQDRATRLWAGLDGTLDRRTAIGHHPTEVLEGARPGPDGVLAAAKASGPAVHQALLRRENDMIWLATVRAVAPGEPGTWPDLESDWDRFDGPRGDAVIGSVRILQARTDRPGVAPDPVELSDAVRAATGIDGAWADTGIAWTDAQLGSFAVWEAPPAGPPPHDPDGRTHRRLVVVAAHDRDPQLSAWTWTRGPYPTPLGRYLLQAATLRHEYRLRGRRDGGTSLDEADRRCERVLALVRGPITADVDPALTALTELTSTGPELVTRATRLREGARNVTIARRNMVLHLGPAVAGPFDDDRRLAEWLERQLDNDLTYVDTALERLRSVAGLGERFVERGLQRAQERLQRRRELQQRRQERFNLTLTGLVGAILMALAAIQAFGYTPPLPPAAVPAMIALLGAFALLMSMIVVRISTTSRAVGWALIVAAGLVGATAGWLVQSWAQEGPVGVTWAAAGVGAVVGVCVTLFRRP